MIVYYIDSKIVNIEFCDRTGVWFTTKFKSDKYTIFLRQPPLFLPSHILEFHCIGYLHRRFTKKMFLLNTIIINIFFILIENNITILILMLYYGNCASTRIAYFCTMNMRF